MKNKNKAFTLIELLLVVGFIALMSVVVYVVLPKVQAQNRANAEQKNIEAISSGIKILYSMKGSYANISTAVVSTSKVAPIAMVSGTNLLNTFGGSVTIDSDSLGGSTNNVYRLTWNGVPDYECVYMMRDIGNQFLQVGINGTSGGALVRPFPGTQKVDIERTSDLCTTGSNAVYMWSR